LDRIDIHLEVPALSPNVLLGSQKNESSACIQKRTAQARRIQQQRFHKYDFYTNAKMDQNLMKRFCRLTEEGTDLLKRAIDELGFSARAHDKVLKIARTIADMDDEENILPEHIAEAIQYRSLDRGWWG